MQAKIASGEIFFSPDETRLIRKIYLKDQEGHVPNSVWLGKDCGTSRSASLELKQILPGNEFATAKPLELLCRVFELTFEGEGIVLDCFGGSGATGHAVIEMNRADGEKRKYVLVEMADYFESVLVPRIKKVIYSKDWKDGKPVSRQGSSHAFKYLRLESYEDALGNIGFANEERGQALMNLEGYALRYMLDFETRDSATFLNIEQLRKPFSYTLDIRNGQVVTSKRVDLPETFAYLIGLLVERRVASERKAGPQRHRYLVYRGKTRDRGADVAVLWRDIEGWKEDDFQAERDWLARDREMKTLLEGVATIYVNGTSTIESAESLDPLFKRLLFAPVATAAA
jgi:adenine-specific DNA-methyltransferase